MSRFTRSLQLALLAVTLARHGAQGKSGHSGGFLARRVILDINDENDQARIFDWNMWAQRPVLVLFRGAATQQVEDEFRTAAKDLRSDMFTVLSGTQESSELKLMNTMNIDKNDDPPILAILSMGFKSADDHATFKTYRFAGAITQSSIKKFVDDYSAGRLHELGMLSEPAPAPEAEYDGAVRQLVGNTFASAVENPSKDTLVYFFATGCGWCLRFKAEYRSLARRLQHVKTLDVTWIDATRNGIPQPKQFPLVALFPAGNRKLPGVQVLNDKVLNAVEYSTNDILIGDGTVDDMIAWLHKEATNAFDEHPPPGWEAAHPQGGLLDEF